jgi:DNA mismatch repair protein MutS
MAKQDDTPLMQQWREAKSRHPDALVFFRVGDFYEMFNEDAVEGAKLLGLTLTSRNNGGASDVPLAGVPARARDEYLERLLRLGRRVAVCEQVEDPATARGLVRREVVETVTPGAVMNDGLLAARRNNWLVALTRADRGDYALAAADVSTGEIHVAGVPADEIESELGALEPSELLLPKSLDGQSVAGADRAIRTYRPDWIFDAAAGEEESKRAWGVQTVAGFGFEEGDTPLLGVLGGILNYLGEVQPSSRASLRPPRIRRRDGAMVLDEMTRRNLELVDTLRPDRRDGAPATLLDVIDDTMTPMGSRLLRRWLLRPLVDAGSIWARQSAVAELVDDAPRRRVLRGALRDVRDLERLGAKVGAGRIGPRELAALGRSIALLPDVRDAVGELGAERIADVVSSLDLLDDVRTRIESALTDEPPAVLGEGGVIRDGYDEELDALRSTRDGAQDAIAAFQAGERTRTGITSLKVGYNKVFGYYIEVTRPNLDRVPSEYERRQTISNAERFVTPDLKEWESRILNAEERIGTLETRLFAELRAGLAREVPRIQGSADAVSELDVLAGLAQTAERRGYARPEVHTGYRLEITAGRHPVVETMMPRERFIPNDIVLDEDGRIVILTGPNMAGKSTLLRQVGLIQLMAQMGSFVPAGSAKLPLCDRIFTRVGASDNLVRGQSTFMVEMQETAAILNGATSHSLVLLDEIGRGTATWDGVSIAWAVTEHLHETIGVKTIFATHYHELTQLADLLPALINLNVAVREVGNEIVFLHQLLPGGADRSYGIEVGRLAGLPEGVVGRAREILYELEGAHSGGGEGLGRSGSRRPASTAKPDQLSLFRAPDHPALVALRGLDPETLTPLEALNVLFRLHARARGETGTDL